MPWRKDRIFLIWFAITQLPWQSREEENKLEYWKGMSINEQNEKYKLQMKEKMFLFFSIGPIGNILQEVSEGAEESG